MCKNVGTQTNVLYGDYFAARRDVVIGACVECLNTRAFVCTRRCFVLSICGAPTCVRCVCAVCSAVDDELPHLNAKRWYRRYVAHGNCAMSYRQTAHATSRRCARVRKMCRHYIVIILTRTSLRVADLAATICSSLCRVYGVRSVGIRILNVLYWCGDYRASK